MTDCLSSRAKYVPLRIAQGESKALPFTVAGPDDIGADITGYSFEAHIRRKPSSTDPVAEFAYDITDAENGLVTIALTGAQTAAIIAGDRDTDPASRYVWDLICTSPGGEVTRLAYGPVVVSARVTRD